MDPPGCSQCVFSISDLVSCSTWIISLCLSDTCWYVGNIAVPQGHVCVCSLIVCPGTVSVCVCGAFVADNSSASGQVVIVLVAKGRVTFLSRFIDKASAGWPY